MSPVRGVESQSLLGFLGRRWIEGWRLLTRKYGKDSWDWWHIDPFIVILICACCALLPVPDSFPLNWGTDKEAANVILACNDKKAVVGMRPDTSTSLSLPVDLISFGEPLFMISF